MSVVWSVMLGIPVQPNHLPSLQSEHQAELANPCSTDAGYSLPSTGVVDLLILAGTAFSHASYSTPWKGYFTALWCLYPGSGFPSVWKLFHLSPHRKKHGWKETRAPSIFWTNSMSFLTQFVLAIFFFLPATIKQKTTTTTALYPKHSRVSPLENTTEKKVCSPWPPGLVNKEHLSVRKWVAFCLIFFLFSIHYIIFSSIVLFHTLLRNITFIGGEREQLRVTRGRYRLDV